MFGRVHPDSTFPSIYTRYAEICLECGVRPLPPQAIWSLMQQLLEDANPHVGVGGRRLH